MNQAPSSLAFPLPAAARARIRATERAETASGPVARKEFRRRGWLERIGLRRSAAQREFATLVALRERGVPVPEPLALERGGGAAGAGGDVVVTRWVDATGDFAAAWSAAAHDPARRRRLATRLGELVRAFHGAGFVHRDLHAGNVLVQRDDALVLLDFHRARRSSSGRARRRDLLALANGFLSRSRAGERLRFLRACGVDRAGRAALIGPALRARLAFQRHHEQRCLGSGRDFRRLDARPAGFAAIARADVPAAEATLATITAGSPGTPASCSAGVVVHAGGDAALRRVELPGLPFPLAVKRFSDRGWLLRWLRGSRARRAWRNLFRLRMAGLATPRMVLMAEGRAAGRGGAGPVSLLVTEFADGHAMLHDHVARAGVAAAWPALARLAADLARMHDEGLTHRDLKAENLLVAPAGDALLFVDADGVRRVERVTTGRAARDLMRLNASFPDGKLVTWSARRRFLAAYRRARTLFRPGLRELWDETARLTARKWRRATSAPR